MEILRSNPEVMLVGCSEGGLNPAVSICYDLELDAKRIARVVDQGHLAVLRHGFASIKISGISRACGRQLLRKAHADYVEMSQRYCNMDNPRFIISKELYDKCDSKIGGMEKLSKYLSYSIEEYKYARKIGATKQAARYLLPQCVETKMVMSGNLQMWWDFFTLRISPRVEEECLEVAKKIFKTLYVTYPNIFKLHPKMDEAHNVFKLNAKMDEEASD